jgi:hypothetical protein
VNDDELLDFYRDMSRKELLELQTAFILDRATRPEPDTVAFCDARLALIKRVLRERVVIRLRYRVLGGHVHCRLFTAPASDQTFAKSGDLVFRVEEWDAVRAAGAKAGFEFVPEEE